MDAHLEKKKGNWCFTWVVIRYKCCHWGSSEDVYENKTWSVWRATAVSTLCIVPEKEKGLTETTVILWHTKVVNLESSSFFHRECVQALWLESNGVNKPNINRAETISLLSDNAFLRKFIGNNFDHRYVCLIKQKRQILSGIKLLKCVDLPLLCVLYKSK